MPRSASSGVVVAGAFVAFFTSAGCGGSSDAPRLVPVSGRVLVDGEPVERLTVIFAPDNQKGTSGPASVGATASDGSFTLTAPGNRSGAVAGFHRVTVTCPFDPSAGSSPTGEKEASSGCALPADYADPMRTPLLIEVTAASASSPVQIEILRKPEPKP